MGLSVSIVVLGRKALSFTHRRQSIHQFMHGHIIPTRTYLLVCGALLVLTGATVAANFVELGVFNTVAALAIAGAKAALIVLYFMHVRYSGGLTQLIVLAGLLWLGLLLVGAMDDYLTRGWLPVPGK